MAEPGSVMADGDLNEVDQPKKQKDELTEENQLGLQQEGEQMPSTSSWDSKDVSMEVSRSLSEREDSTINSTSLVSSVMDDTPSISTLNQESSLLTDDPLLSLKSSPDSQSEAAQTDINAAGVEVTAGATSAPVSVPVPAAVVPRPEYYYVKWITWKEQRTPIITQSENGPCPLLAIMNILFLRWKAKLPVQTEVITIDELMAHLGECVLSVKPREKAKGMELNFQQNMSDAMAVLPKLSTGLDVNVRFTAVTDFEYTPECIVFDLLDIPLYHGWLVDPQSSDVVSAVGKLSYNQLVEKIINYKLSADSSRVSEGLIAEQFLESTATQLSYHGLCELNAAVKEGELCVFFRNNHFSTMIKHKGHLYLLVTDQGFLQEDSMVWESLHNVEGDGNFCDSDFRLCQPTQKSTAPTQVTVQQQQIDQDYLVAMSLQQDQGDVPGPLSDLELARQLQQEEYQQPQQPPHTSTEQVRGGQTASSGRRRQGEKKDDSDCSIL